MRVMHLVADGNLGGGTTNVLALARHGASQPAERRSIVTDRGSNCWECAKELGLDRFGIPFFGPRLDPRPVFHLRSAVRAWKPDLIHVHGGRALFHAAFVPEIRSTPVVYTVHGYHFRHKPAAIRQLAIQAERFGSSVVDQIAFVSQHDQDVCERFRLNANRVPTSVIHNGIEHLEPRPAQRQPNRIAFFGRLTFPKDPGLFLDVVDLLADEPYEFLMIGGGEDEAAVRERIRRSRAGAKIELTGTLPREEALHALRTCSVLLLTSRWEGLPTVVMEAMALEVAVIAADVGGTNELVEDGKTGLLIADRNPHSFAGAVRRLMGNPGLRAQILRDSLEKVRSQFTRATTFAAYDALYRQVAQQAKRN